MLALTPPRSPASQRPPKPCSDLLHPVAVWLRSGGPTPDPSCCASPEGTPDVQLSGWGDPGGHGLRGRRLPALSLSAPASHPSPLAAESPSPQH